MKRKCVYSLFTMMIISILSLVYYYFWTANLKLKEDLEKQKEMTQSWENSHFNLKEYILKYIKYDKMAITPNYILKSENGTSVHINDLFKGKSQKLIVRIPKESCLNCIMSFTHILQQELSEYEQQNIAYIVDYKKAKEIEYYKRILNINSKFYIAHDLDLPIEKEDTPYIFLLNKDLTYTHLYMPIYNEADLSKKYIQIIKEQLRNNIN